MKSTLLNMILSLTTLTLLVGAALGVVNYFTTEPIAKANEAARHEAIAAILPPFDRLESQTGGELTVYPAFDGPDLAGLAVETYSDAGFGGRIVLMAGFDADGRLTGYRVLSHAETPGLGAKMDTWFQTDKVIGTDTDIAVRADGGDIDAITGATITSRAFTDAINRARHAFNDYNHGSK